MDTSLSSSLAFLYEHSKNCAGFKDAIMLGRVWLYQRELESNRTGSGFSAFLFAMLMGYLLQGGLSEGGRKLSAGHSSYQLLRGTIDFLSTHDFEKEPVMIGEYDHPDVSLYSFVNLISFKCSKGLFFFLGGRKQREIFLNLFFLSSLI